MSAKHTPGPWTYEGDHTHRQYNIRMLSREEKHICTVNNLPPHVLANRDQSTAEANARLIAAAPDLLASLQELLALHIAHHNAIEHAAARKLIRRATGDA